MYANDPSSSDLQPLVDSGTIIEAAGTPIVRVSLVRHVFVNANAANSLTGGGPFSPSAQEKASDFLERPQMYKSSVIGDGVLFTPKIERESVTWSGEVWINPRSGVNCGGFSTKALTVRVGTSFTYLLCTRHGC